MTVKAQKSMKSIIRIVHLPPVVQSEFNETTRILFEEDTDGDELLKKVIFIFFAYKKYCCCIVTIRLNH